MDKIESPQLKDVLRASREVSLWTVTGPAEWAKKLNLNLHELETALARWDALEQARKELAAGQPLPVDPELMLNDRYYP